MSLCTYQGGSSSSTFCVFHWEYIWRHTQMRIHSRARTHIRSYMQTPTHARTHVSITSQHPPLYSNQGWKYHQTGPDPRTFVEIYPGRTLETVNRESSFPSSSYASGPRGPPWTERRTGQRKKEGGEERMEIMVDTWRKGKSCFIIRNRIIDEEYLHLSSAPLQVHASIFFTICSKSLLRCLKKRQYSFL